MNPVLTWKAGLQSAAWRPFLLDGDTYLLKSVTDDTGYHVAISDLVSIWFEEVDSNGFQSRSKVNIIIIRLIRFLKKILLDIMRAKPISHRVLSRRLPSIENENLIFTTTCTTSVVMFHCCAYCIITTKKIMETSYKKTSITILQQEPSPKLCMQRNKQ